MFGNKIDWCVEEYEEAIKLEGSYKKRKKWQGSFVLSDQPPLTGPGQHLLSEPATVRSGSLLD